MKLPLATSVIPLLALAACGPAPKRTVELCELGGQIERFASQIVTVEGELLVSTHGSAVVDPSCDKGVPITWTREDNPRLKEFGSLAKRMRDEPQRPFARVRVTGTIKRAARSEFLDEPYWYLDLSSAQVLSK